MNDYDCDDVYVDEDQMLRYLMGVDIGSPDCPWEREDYMNELPQEVDDELYDY